MGYASGRTHARLAGDQKSSSLLCPDSRDLQTCDSAFGFPCDSLIYFFRVFGLDRMLDLPAGAFAADLKKAMKGHVIQKGEAMATCGR